MSASVRSRLMSLLVMSSIKILIFQVVLGVSGPMRVQVVLRVMSVRPGEVLANSVCDLDNSVAFRICSQVVVAGVTSCFHNFF